jgi:hypothetical protein
MNIPLSAGPLPGSLLYSQQSLDFTRDACQATDGAPTVRCPLHFVAFARISSGHSSGRHRPFVQFARSSR